MRANIRGCIDGYLLIKHSNDYLTHFTNRMADELLVERVKPLVIFTTPIHCNDRPAIEIKAYISILTESERIDLLKMVEEAQYVSDLVKLSEMLDGIKRMVINI